MRIIRLYYCFDPCKNSQDYNSPLAELCSQSEHGDGKHSILHDNNIESWRRDSTLVGSLMPYNCSTL